MPLDPTDLPTLSRLLDEALDLSPADLEIWLTAVATEHRHLLPRLRDMLAVRSARGNTGFLSDGPKIDAALTDETVARVGDLIGPYRLIREIGHGGMGTVWLAERADGTLKRQIALKLPRLAWGAGLAERMARERDIGALLEHPNIARLYDAGVDAKGRPYLALEYIDGVSIDAWCVNGALDVRARLTLFLQVIKAAAYAHGRLVVHRDLKPSNVLVTSDGQAHLLDFGIAKLLLDASSEGAELTQQVDRLLTPQYASPEQIRGDAITVASDVYSLGVLLYELLTRQLPYETVRRTLGAIENAIFDDEPAPASSRAAAKADAEALRGELDAILAKALKREPNQRYATADAMAEDIVRHLEGERVLAQRDSFGYRMRKVMRKHRAAFAATGFAAAAVLGGAGISVVQAKRANDAAERARVVKEFVVDVFKVNERGTQGNSELRQLPAELLLDRGAKLIQTKFPGQPRLQAELYGVVGGIFADMGVNELAADYATRQVAALVECDASSIEQAKAMMLLTEARIAEHRLHDADAGARRTLALAKDEPALEAQARLLFARVLVIEGKFDEAGRLLDIVKGQLRSETLPTVVEIRATSLEAVILSVTNRFDEAFPLYSKAIEEAVASEGPMSSLVIGMRLNVAYSLIIHDRTDEALPLIGLALDALRATGSWGEIRAALEEAELVEIMVRNGAIDVGKARVAIEGDRALLASRGPLVPDRIRATVDFKLASTDLFAGDIQRALPLLNTSASVLRQRLDNAHDRFELAALQGMAAMFAGHHEEADGFLKEQMAARAETGGALSPYAAYDYAWRALNSVMAREYEKAVATLTSAPDFEALRGTKSEAGTDYQRVLETVRARLQLDRDRPSAALALSPEGRVADALPFDNQMLRGEIQCALGRRTEGLALLAASIARHEPHVHEHHPELARARAVSGMCALADGNRALAADLAARARASLVAQPEVSPYFKRPSERLDRMLAVSTASR